MSSILQVNLSCVNCILPHLDYYCGVVMGIETCRKSARLVKYFHASTQLHAWVQEHDSYAPLAVINISLGGQIRHALRAKYELQYQLRVRPKGYTSSFTRYSYSPHGLACMLLVLHV